MKKSILGSFLLIGSLNAGTINIAVAANVSYAIETIKIEFHKLYPDTHVNVTFGSSGKLTAQIKNGAPYQLFMSANMKYPLSLYKDTIAVTKPLVYAKGSLAYMSGKKQDFSKGINIVENPNIEKIAIANPKTAPYGKATIEALKNAGLYEKVKKKLVYGESISQTAAYAVTAADIGFIAKSSLFSPQMSQYKEGIHWSSVNPKLYTPINQGIVVLKNAETNSEVSAFYNFIFSEKAKEILNNFGYSVP